MGPEFTPPPSQPKIRFNQHSTRTPSHLDIFCIYYPSPEVIPSPLPIVVIFKIGDEINRFHILNSRIPDAIYVHKSYLPSFPEFFSVSHQYQLNPFSTYFEIIPHPRFVAFSETETYMANSDTTYLPVLDPRGFTPNQHQSESDIPYLLIPDPRLVTPKKQYNLNPDFPWNVPTIYFPPSAAPDRVLKLGTLPVMGTQYLFACYARDLCKHFQLQKRLQRTYICANCRAKLSGQNYQMHLISHSKKDGKQLMEKSKKKRYTPNPSESTLEAT